MGSVDGLVSRARARGRPLALSPEPKLRTLVLTCMDARIDPTALFGLQPGDAHVLRNAGARATPDVFRSVALSQAILGTREVLVLGHTGCGLHGRTEAELAGMIRSASGADPGMVLGGFHDLDDAVLQSVEALRQCAFIAHRDRIRGFVYELESGTVRPAGTPLKPHRPDSRREPLSGLEGLRADVLNLRRGAARKH